MARKFSELRAKMSVERQEQAAVKARDMIQKMKIAEKCCTLSKSQSKTKNKEK